MRNILIAGVLVGLASTAPAVAADTPAASAAQAPTAEGTAKPEKRICKRDNAVGTRLARATCLTIVKKGATSSVENSEPIHCQ